MNCQKIQNAKTIFQENNSCKESPLTPCDDLPLMTELGIKPHETVHSNSDVTHSEVLSSSSS